MANEQHRAQRIQSDFQKLLAELKEQDDQWLELLERAGVDPEAFFRQPERADAAVPTEGPDRPPAHGDPSPIPIHAIRA